MDEAQVEHAIRIMKNSLLFIALFTTLISFSQEIDFFASANSFFAKHVSEGKVDYPSIHSDQTELGELIAYIEKNEWTAEDEKAYLINVYNLLVLNKIIQHYPISSPMEVDGFFDKKDIIINNEKTSLNILENEILRPKYQDARLHFVLVCGAIGCPPLVNFAYQPASLEDQLEKQTKSAINDPTFIHQKENTNQLSEIFNWYQSDFGGNIKETIAFINRYRQDSLDPNQKTVFYPYDWTLNSSQTDTDNTLANPNTTIDLQTFTAGSLLGKNKFDFTLFSTLYTETKSNWMGQDFTGFRSTFVTNLFQVTYGLTKSKRLNIGIDLNVRNNGRSNDDSFAGLKPAFAFSNTDSSRFGLTSVGLRLKVQPFAKVNDFTIQSTFYTPTVKSPEGASNLFWADWDRYTWWNQFFYTKTWGKFQLFTEIDLWFRFGRAANQIDMLDIPVSAFFSYFPNKKITIYAMSQHVHRFTNNIEPQNPNVNDWVIPMNYSASGLGMKFNITTNFNLELLYTNFWRGKNSGLGSTFNVGLKYVMF